MAGREKWRQSLCSTWNTTSMNLTTTSCFSNQEHTKDSTEPQKIIFCSTGFVFTNTSTFSQTHGYDFRFTFLTTMRPYSPNFHSNFNLASPINHCKCISISHYNFKSTLLELPSIFPISSTWVTTRVEIDRKYRSKGTGGIFVIEILGGKINIRKQLKTPTGSLVQLVLQKLKT